MSELLPCPFCGCTAIYETHTHYYDDEDTAVIFCNGCKSVVILEQNEAEGINDETMKLARDTWNTRAERTCRWEYPQGVNGWIGYMVCSNCGERYDETVTDGANYCPNCGCKVVGE